MRVYLLRHAQTAWSLSGQHTGKTDIELTDVGRAEATALTPHVRQLLDGAEFDVVYSSPRKRALQTLELALGRRQGAVVTDLLAEVDYGSCEGLTAEQIRQTVPDWTFWTHDCAGGETIEEAAARADQFIALLLERHQGQTICAVSHGHMIRILAARLVGIAPRRGKIFDIKTASIAELVQKDGAFVVSRWNFTA